MTDNEINSIKTDVALIKRDITQISNVYKKVDDTLEHMSEVAKNLAVQDKILENQERRIKIIEENFVRHNEDEVEFRKDLNKRLDDMTTKASVDRDKRHREVMEAFEKMSGAVNKRLEDQDKRIATLEQWKWYVAGVMAVIVIIINKFPWTMFFGG
jgi:hypothetical protein